MNFDDHKEATAADCESVAKILSDLAVEVRKGNMAAFEAFWWEGGTEEGDAKIMSIRELLILRYGYRREQIKA